MDDARSDRGDAESDAENADDERPSQQYSTQILGLTALVVLGIGTVAYRLLEDWSWVDSLYFSIVTLTTVGYGDLSPTSDASKLFTVLYLAVGVSLLAATFNEILKRRQRHRRARRARRR